MNLPTLQGRGLEMLQQLLQNIGAGIFPLVILAFLLLNWNVGSGGGGPAPHIIIKLQN